jgi:hypothetical protein
MLTVIAKAFYHLILNALNVNTHLILYNQAGKEIHKGSLCFTMLILSRSSWGEFMASIYFQMLQLLLQAYNEPKINNSSS